MADNSKSLDTFLSARKEIRSGSLKPVYIFAGEEVFFEDEIQKDILSLVPVDMKDFNLDIFYGNETSIDNIINTCKSFPMMSDRRVVIVREFMSLFDKKEAELIEEGSDIESRGDADELINYFLNPNLSTLLVLTDRRKPNGKTKFGKTANSEKTHVGFFNFDRISEYQVPDWIIKWAESTHKKNIHPKAAQILAQYLGSNLQLLSIEIEKLCTQYATNQVISEEDVKVVSSIRREYSVFELKDAVISRNLNKSLSIAEQMLQRTSSDVGEVIKTVGFFYSLFSNFWQIQRLTQKGIPAKQIQEITGISNTWYFNNLVKESRSFRTEEMPAIFEALHDADIAVKGFSKVDTDAILLIMLRRIIGK